MAARSLPSGGGGDDEISDGIVAEINITPLTDIFLVLLIIFMVTTSVISNQGKEVDLPNSAVASTTPTGVSVTMTSEGEIEVDGKAVAEANLAAALKEALDKAKEKIVILRGDKKVLLGKAVNILDLAQEAGAKGIALATKPPAPGEK
jgi:biopolymer transport protein ExbD